jgi:cellulose synthase/poly-beta-1,6-N-acetylglucosamine synthase-like glycosyltransferase
MIFSDPTHKRVFILLCVLFGGFLIWLYFHIFYPLQLEMFYYGRMLPFRIQLLKVLNRVMVAFLLLHYLKLLAYLVLARRSKQYSKTGFNPKVCAIIPAYNEEKVIEKTIRSVLASDYKRLEIWVVDDGSSDRTREAVEEAFRDNARVHLISQENSGKAVALNTGIAAADGDMLLLLDADTVIAPDAVRLMVRHFEDARVAAVAGNTRVGNVMNLITGCQRVEYIRDFNLIKNGMSRLQSMAVVPGALGMWRRSAVLEAGGFSTQTLGEDRDLTMKLMSNGKKTVFEPLAYSRTEAPSTLRAFLKQRFRWTYGTLQCMAKHLKCIFSLKSPGLGFLLIPDLLLFQTVIPVISILVLLANLGLPDRYELMLLATSVIFSFIMEMLFYYISLIYTRERPKIYDVLIVPLQRVIYGFLCTYVMIKALVIAFLGGRVGWNKLDRTGNVDNA